MFGYNVENMLAFCRNLCYATWRKKARFFTKLLPFFPSKKDSKKLVYALVYHVIVQLACFLVFFVVFLLCSLLLASVVLAILGVLGILFMFLLVLISFTYTIIGIGLSICSYCGVEFLEEFQPTSNEPIAEQPPSDFIEIP